MKKILLVVILALVAQLTLAQNLPSYLPTNGLVGYWGFSGNANDESGNGYNGLITGATLTTDRFGQANNAFAFNGKTVPGTNNTVVQRDEVIQIPGFTYNFGIGFTVSFWSTDDGGIQRRTDNNIDFAVGISGIHLGSIGMVGISNIPDGLWHHYSYTYNGSSIKQYKDGNLISTSNSSGSMSTNTTEMQFGRYIYHGGLTHYFYLNGLLDDIGFWNRALTQEEITQLYTGNSCNASITSSETTICSGSSSVNLSVNLSGESGTSANCFSPKVVGLSNTNFGMNATCSDNNGNLFVAGAYTGNTNFGNLTLAGIGGKDVFLVKYNSCGVQQWALRGGSTGNEDYAGVGTKSIATDASGNIFIVGRYNQTFTFYGNNNTSFVAPYTSTGNGNHQDGYLIKLNASGEVLWGATLRGGSNDGFNGVAVDNSGNPIVTGGFNGCCPSTFAVTIYGPNGSLGVSSFGSNYGSGLVVKFDANGNILWKAAVYNRDAELNRLAIDGTNNIYLVSAFRSWGSGTAAQFIDANGTNNSLYNPGIGLGFLVKLNSSGIWQWGTSYGNVGDGVGSLTNGTDVAIDENGNPWISGVYRGATATFYSTSGSTLSLPASTNDIGFIAKYSSSGVPQFVNSLQQSTGSTYFSSIAISNGTVGIAGYFTGNNLGSNDMLFAKYDTNAVFQSVNTGGGSGDDQANSVISNSTGFVVSGVIGGTSSIDGVSLNSAGTFLWNNYTSRVSLNSFLWSTGETTATINPSPTETTTYWCDVTTNSETCRKEITITVNDSQITASTSTVSSGTSVNLTVKDGNSLSNVSPTWELLISSSNYNGSNLNFSETGYNRNENLVYSINGNSSTIFNLNTNTVNTKALSNVGSVGPFTYDYTNNRLIYGRSGRDNLYAIPANGGNVTQFGSGSFDSESYGGRYFWNPTNQKIGLFGGYGFYAVKNWIWETNGTWTNPYVNSSNCNATTPSKRNGQFALGAPNSNKLYLFSGQGSCDGNQLASSCSLGSPWATDVGIYCWLKDLWELDLQTYTFKNILPVNSASITKEGNFVYDYIANTFYIIGGYIPSATYNSNSGNIIDFETSILRYRVGVDSGFLPYDVLGTPPPSVKLNNLGANGTYYDATNNQIVWIRKDGVWGVKLSGVSQATYSWSTGETTSTINPTPTETTTFWCDVTVDGVTCRKEITIMVGSLGIEYNAIDLKIKVYPNPTSQLLYVSHPEQKNFSIRITDLNGKQMYSGTMTTAIPLDITKYPQGMYLVTVSSKETNQKNSFKILKK